MALRPDPVGATGDPVEFGWTLDDTMLDAVAVGAGHDDPLHELTATIENSEGVVAQVLPAARRS